LRKGGVIEIDSVSHAQRKEIFFTTTNLGKFKEAALLAEEHGITLKHLSFRAVEIQSDSLTEIAKHSLLDALNKHKVPMVVEDAGLFVEVLKGFPGPYSAYIYHTIGFQGILKMMGEIGDRRAHFLSAVAYGSPRTEPMIFTGRVDGIIATDSRGKGGFGFDPIFQLQDESRTFAEITSEEKNRYSHRAIAFKKLADWLSET